MNLGESLTIEADYNDDDHAVFDHEDLDSLDLNILTPRKDEYFDKRPAPLRRLVYFVPVITLSAVDIVQEIFIFIFSIAPATGCRGDDDYQQRIWRPRLIPVLNSILQSWNTVYHQPSFPFNDRSDERTHLQLS
ncbi:hypothetical protein BGZ88_011963 [Linnemannia elongata]|nr:hypothetical protein BGZ88_011963 [Linnemannia elongata]